MIIRIIRMINISIWWTSVKTGFRLIRPPPNLLRHQTDNIKFDGLQRLWAFRGEVPELLNEYIKFSKAFEKFIKEYKVTIKVEL